MRCAWGNPKQTLPFFYDILKQHNGCEIDMHTKIIPTWKEESAKFMLLVKKGHRKSVKCNKDFLIKVLLCWMLRLPFSFLSRCSTATRTMKNFEFALTLSSILQRNYDNYMQHLIYICCSRTLYSFYFQHSFRNEKFSHDFSLAFLWMQLCWVWLKNETA